MGRGRQKAKQTKVARELKYHSSSMDVTALQRELSSEPGVPVPRRTPEVEVEDDPYAEDPYARYSFDDQDDRPTGRYA